MQEVSSLPVFGPSEDLMLGILRPHFEHQGVTVATQFSKNMQLPAIVARQDRKSGTATHTSQDPRFLAPSLISIDTLCDGPDADEMSAHLQEAVRLVVYNAWAKQVVIPGVGYISRINNSGNAYRASDWATSTGVVQYAALPHGVVRYERMYHLYVRPDQNQERTFNPFVRQLNKP